MRLDSKSGLRGMLMNRDTGQCIRWVRWAEIPEDPEQPGEFEAFRVEPQGWKDMGFDLAEIIYRGRARLRFVPAAPKFATIPKASDPRDLSGSLNEARKRLVEPKLLVPGEECEERFCHRLSSFRVSEEQEIEPECGPDGKLYERAIAVRVRCFCELHYRQPLFTSVRGVQKEVEVEEGMGKPLEPVKVHYTGK